MIPAIQNSGILSPTATQGLSNTAQTPGADFANLFGEILGSANEQQLQANQAVIDLATGQNENLHQVLLEVAKADIAFRMVLEIRNRLMEAYQEVMRMQV